jgi:hypothetical protein
MNIAIGIALIAHGIAHLLGFLVPWRIINSEEMPYRTTLLSGKADIGNVGIRVVGLFWLAIAAAFICIGAGAILETTWWLNLLPGITMFSLLFSILSWPESKIGVLINVIILTLLGISARLDWSL